MNENAKPIGPPDTEAAWNTGELGRDEEYVGLSELSPEEENAIDDAAGLKAISIRLEKSLIEDFKMIAALHGLGYQPLMRQALRRFADCEKKHLLRQAYEAALREQQEQEQKQELERKVA